MKRGSRIAHRLQDEQGQVLVLAIAIVVVGLLLALGAVAYAMQASTQSVHDERNRGAQQAADAGVQRQLLLNTDSDSVGYNLNSGVLGLGTFLDCTVPELGVGAGSLNLQVGTLQVAAGSAGVCPVSCTSTTCTPGPPGKLGWQPLGNQDYYESEFLANAQESANSGSTGNGDAVEFPEIVSIGCHTTNSTDPQSSCLNGASGNDYYRQLSLLDPTGPLQTVEGTNNVTVNSGLNVLNALISSQDVSCTTTVVLTVPFTSCSVNNSNGLLGVLAATVQSVLGTVCSVTSLVLQGKTSDQSCVVNYLISQVDSATNIGLVDGNITAGHNLTLPNITVDAQLSTGTLSALGSSLQTVLQGVLTDVGNVVTLLSHPQTLFSTFTYGNQVCNGSTSTCSGAATDTSPITALAPSFVKSSGACQPGKPQSNCIITRPSFSVTSVLTSAATSGTSTIPAAPTGATTAPTLTPGGVATYVDGDLTLTSGTLTLSPGTYVFCGVYASGGTIAGGGGVQVFVLAPGAPQCTTQPTAGTPGYVQPGNFVACNGVDNTLGDTSLYSLGTVTSTLTPSAFQIYVQGNTKDADATSLTVGNTDKAVTVCPNMNVAAGSEPYTSSSTPLYNSTQDPATQVYIGALTSSATEGIIVYAPESEVTINAIAAFEGSAVGFNSDITAVALLQDLDLGNYPLSTVANAYQVSQTVQCNSSIEALSDQEVGNPAQHSSAATVPGAASSGGVGDLNGC